MLWLLPQAGWGCAQATTDDVLPGDGAGASGGSGGDTGAVGGDTAMGGMLPAGSGGMPASQAGATGNAGTNTGGIASGGAAGSGGASGGGGVGGAAGKGGGGGVGGIGGAAGKGGGGGVGGAPDQCPNDPQKTSPGKCGCGVPEVCAELEAGLAHRYSFSSNDMTATDSVGNADGTLVAVTAAGGKVTFNGADDAYVNLPNGVVSSLTNATFEIWFNWGGGPVWQRIFDFGTNDQGEGNRGTGLSYLYLCPSDGDAGNNLRSSFSINGSGNETTVKGVAPLPSGSAQHIAVVVDDAGNQLRLYLNGAQVSSTAFTGALSGITDNNTWLGRSNWNDPPLKGSIDEFRVYDIALTAAQITASKDFGPDPAFLQ